MKIWSHICLLKNPGCYPLPNSFKLLNLKCKTPKIVQIYFLTSSPKNYDLPGFVSLHLLGKSPVSSPSVRSYSFFNLSDYGSQVPFPVLLSKGITYFSWFTQYSILISTFTDHLHHTFGQTVISSRAILLIVVSCFWQNNAHSKCSVHICPSKVLEGL